MQFYDRTRTGNSPVSLEAAKSYLKLPSAVGPDDDLIQLLIDAATDHAEKYTARELRANRWSLFIDLFERVICIDRNPVASVTSVTRLVDDVVTAVDPATYYLVSQTQFSAIALQPDQSWPDDQDEVAHAIEVAFQTKAHTCLSQATVGILRHVAFLYEDRGDCPEGADGSGELSGANKIYDLLRIARV